MQTIHVDTELPTSADAVWQAMQHAESLRYVTRGLFRLPALAGRTQPFLQGERGTCWLLLFHVLPAWRHTIHLEELDPATRTMRSREHGGVIRRWEHTLHVQPVAEQRCRYSDTVTIDAGLLTGLVAAIARQMYRIRQRRWHTLTRKHLLPTGPSYAARPDPQLHHGKHLPRQHLQALGRERRLLRKGLIDEPVVTDSWWPISAAVARRSPDRVVVLPGAERSCEVLLPLGAEMKSLRFSGWRSGGTGRWRAARTRRAPLPPR